ncbi:ribosome biogenesis GTP-binding protein YihA/YsxC [Thermodesulfobacteriota bacterium]
MIVKTAEFVKSAVRPSQYPPAGFPEVAFTGRSNVGKSSLINTILNRKRLVKTSSTPGRTQLINFFLINQSLSFVDLPGYGYAKVPGSVKKKWGPMIETYLSTRETLKGVTLIMDIRRSPGQEEILFMDWLDHFRIPCIMILTKTDKLSKSKQKQQHLSIAKALNVDHDQLILFSAKSRVGKDVVWKALGRLLYEENNR